MFSEESVKVNVTPAHKQKFDIMKEGVLLHLDRKYTYDVIPHELLGGLLFQGIHRPPKDYVVEIDLLAPATIYFFFIIQPMVVMIKYLKILMDGSFVKHFLNTMLIMESMG